MSRPLTSVVVVVIVGPQASGKSTLATALSRELRGRGDAVALVELDRLAAMALPTLPDWDVAHGIFESVTGQWARAGLTCVIAEGSGSHDEVSRLRAEVLDAAVAMTVAVTAPFTVALARARRDGSRGVSRGYGFLKAVYERWPAELSSIDADVIVDTGELSVERCVELICLAIESARRVPSSRR